MNTMDTVARLMKAQEAEKIYCELRYGRALNGNEQSKIDAYVEFLPTTKDYPLANRNRKMVFKAGLLPAATHLLRYIETTSEDERSKHRTELYLIRGY